MPKFPGFGRIRILLAITLASMAFFVLVPG
jgi:hypothetical protein